MPKSKEPIPADFAQLFAGQQILQGMPELAYVFDKEGRMVMWNRNVEIILGYSKDELHHKLVTDFIDEPDRDEVLKVFMEVLTDGKERTVEYNMLLKSGEKIPYIGSGSLMIKNGKKYLVGMAINTRKLKETEIRLMSHIDETKTLKDQLKAENIYLREEIKSAHDFEDIIGESEPLMHAFYRVKQVSSMDTTVLLEGETGTGKELFAMAIHSQSKRRDKSFVKVNCASLPASLIESELFGHEKGAFTGAIERQYGRFELANKGTIFLDEIGELPLELQPKILRVLQEGEFERVGNPNPLKVDIRIIAATNRKLEDDIQQGLFRKDLYYRLKVYPITIAPLRERISDIPLLVENFVKRFNLKLGKCITKIPAKTIKQLQSYSWPGNVRELQNVIERAVIISPSTYLIVDQLHKPDFEEENKLLSLSDFERQYILKVLKKTYWRIEGPDGAARILDMHPETLRSRMRKLSIHRPKP